MLLVGEDALEGLENLVVVAALPFAVVMVLLAVALVRDLRSDPTVLRKTAGNQAMEHAVVEGLSKRGDEFTLVVGGGASEEPEEQPRDQAHHLAPAHEAPTPLTRAPR